MEFLKGVGVVVGGLLALFVVIVFFSGLDFGLTSFFSPKYEQVRRNTFEQSRAYNEGMRRDLESIRNSYLVTSDPVAKQALRATILQKNAIIR